MKSAKNRIRSGEPFLIYHNAEDEMSFVVPAEFLTGDLYRTLRRYATSDMALMIPEQVAVRLGMPYLSESLKLSADLDSLKKDAIVRSNAGPTFGLKNVKSGSADQDKVSAVKRLSEIVANNEIDLFFEEFAMPGHVRTYIARKGLLGERIGHTELGVFLSLYAGLSGLICMVTLRDAEEGRPLNKAEGESFAKKNGYYVFYEDDILEIYKDYRVNGGGRKRLSKSKEKLIDDYQKLIEIRQFESIIEELFNSKKIQGSYHLAVGQEATGVALGNVVEKGDSVFVTHRGHHIALGMGVDVQKFFLECIGEAGGINKGLSGPMHFFVQKPNRIIANGIVGANAPLAAGVALSNKISANGKVSINVMGEGALDEGPVHESLIMASIWELPLVIICENNFYSQTTPVEKHLPTANIASHVENTYKISAERIAEGTNLILLENRLRDAREYVRKTSRPIFLEVLTYRHSGHSMSDVKQEYKDPDLDKHWRQRDPIHLFERFLIDEMSIDERKLVQIRKEAEDKIKRKINEVL